ncbi:hypothetical protein [Desertibacillus haloalkaliphilus]|uniref:hypothetical protein n=1 Tax=Desertibacillus haloalkaliphilus TaxID=1328930 RepID=UPI001C27CD12|nr:hypothetical protein [Desertibacillus haloalkaliphilus]MBU8907671.1 hypothetical protein [Desertibacillus haloalkaliphilus]
MRDTYHEFRALLSAEVPPEDILVTFEPEQDAQAKSSEQKENEIGTRANPLVIGERITLNYYDLFYGNVELEMELLEVMSGEEAWNIVREANQFNEAPGEGQEYILARYFVKINEVEEEPYDLTHAQFDAVSTTGNTYDDFISVSGLEPDLRNEMYTGAEREGFTYFLVEKDDEDPLVAFKRRSDVEVWFKMRD